MFICFLNTRCIIMLVEKLNFIVYGGLELRSCLFFFFFFLAAFKRMARSEEDQVGV